MGQQVLAYAGAIVGAIVGSYTGIGPYAGASIGFTIGGGVGSLLFPTKIEGPHMRQLMAQSAAYGTPLPFGYGSFRVAATLIWQIPIGEQSSTQGGKGGPQLTSYSYFGCFAVALCEGPIVGIRRLWANGICIYDVSSTASPATVAASIAFAQQYLTIYLGTTTQGVDPTMQSVLGVGNVPAYRGTAYVVFINIPLANYGNVLPSINAEIVVGGQPAGAMGLIFENDATGAPFHRGNSTGNGDASLMPVITQISPQLRICDSTPFISAVGGDGICRLFDPSTGVSAGTEGMTSFELIAVQSVSNFATWGPFTGVSIEPVMPLFDGSGIIGVHIDYPVQQSPQVSGDADATHASLYVLNAGATTVVYDIIPVLTMPTGGGGTYTLKWAIPCADGQHILCLVIGHDSAGGGTGTDYFALTIVAVSSSTPPTAVSSQTFSMLSATTGTLWTNHFTTWAVASWWNAYAFTFPRGMMESSFASVWFFTDFGSGGCVLDLTQTPPAQVLASGQTAGTLTEFMPGASGADGSSSIWADGGVCYVVSGIRIAAWGRSVMAIAQVPLSSIVTDIAERAGVPAGSITASALTDGVWGFVLDRQMTARAALEALAPAFWFDAVESDQKLKFVHRSSSSAITIPLDDLVIDPSGGKHPPLVFTRGSEIELPTQINLTYYAVAASFQPGTQYARRISTTQQENLLTVDSACVMDDNQAAVAAAIMLWDAIAGRVGFKFSTSMKYAPYEPTDVVTLQTTNESYLVRLTRKTENNGKIDWEAVGCAPVYSQSVSGGAIQSAQGVSGTISTRAMILDLPPLRDQDGTNPNLYVAMAGLATGWPGGTLFKSSDNGATFLPGITMTTPATFGQATTALGSWSGGNIFDELNTVTVSVNAGQTLSSAVELSVLNGANVALLGNEILQFKNATLVSTGLYKLSGLLRGRFGTEAGESGHGVGDRFVLLTGTLGLQVASTADIGQARIYDAVTINQPLATGQKQTITETGATLIPWSPVLLFATNNGVAGDISLRWTRRNRLTWQWLPAVDVPMSEATEAYVVSIFSGASVIRTINVSAAQTATYTSAQQTTDFGAPLAPGASFTFGVQQVSAVTGPGVMAKMSILLPTLQTVPGAPTIGTATGGNAQATVAFTAPANNGGSPITSYTATSSPGGFTASGSASPLTVTGLTNGTAYTFTVTATNALGTGAASAASNSVTPATVPGAPTIGTATAGNASASVAFTAPGSNGGSAITSYTATSSPGGITASGSSSPINVTGLTNGTAYTFTVTATNAIGTGAASAASNSVTPAAGSSILLMHFDDTNGSTTFTDVYGNVFSQQDGSGATISTAQSVFGGSSLRLNGTGGVSTAGHTKTSDWDWGTGDFTIECRFRCDTISTQQSIITLQQSGSTQAIIRLDVYGSVIYGVIRDESGSNLQSLTGTTTLASNTWYAACIERKSGTVRLYINGNVEATLAGSTQNLNFHYTTPPFCYGEIPGNGLPMTGYVDECRVSKAALYGGAYTPASSAFTS